MPKKKKYTSIKVPIPLSIKIGTLRLLGESKADVIARHLKLKRIDEK